MASVGFIGLGTMGRPMARNLLRAGHRLAFFARREDVAAEFSALGGSRHASPADLVGECDLVISIVTADRQVEEIALAERGLAHGDARGKLLVDMSTIGPDTVRRVAAGLNRSGMDMIDAPVSGGPGGAAAATLAIMAGGDERQFARARPVLAALGNRIFHAGPLGAGQTMKLVNQLLGAGIMALIGEGLSLAKAAGVSLPTLCDAIEASSGNSTLFQARAKKHVLLDNYQPGFTAELMRKDLRLALDLAARHNVPAPVAAATLRLYDAALERGLGEQDFAVVAKVCAAAAGVSLAEPWPGQPPTP